MQTSGFADQSMGELVAMTLQDLKDRRALWHGKLKPGQRKEILHAVFNESLNYDVDALRAGLKALKKLS